MDKNRRGVIVESGAQDWQIFQQDKNGVATISLRGRWLVEEKLPKTPKVLVRVVQEDCYETVTQSLDWQAATTRKNATWFIDLKNVPCGGLYRIETILQFDVEPPEWGCRGDIVHHVGVGDIWVITGQSNATGYGRSPITDGPELGVHMFHASGQWKLAAHPLGDSTGSVYPPNREGTNASHSPWLAFARKLKAALGHPIGLIPASLGGSAMWMWHRARGNVGEWKRGFLFDNMLRYIDDAGGKVRGALWYQGESDCDPNECKLYAKRFTAFVKDLRKCVGDPKLPVLTVQLNRCAVAGMLDDTHDPASPWSDVREIQRRLAHTIPGVTVTSMLGLNIVDAVHNESAGNVILGERVAACALGFVHGRDVKYLCPDIHTAKQLARARIELVFDNVDATLQLADLEVARFPIAVSDKDGVVPVRAWTIKQPNRILITLARPLNGAATVTGAPGLLPDEMPIVDVAGYRPMLAFKVKVTPKA